MKAKYVVAVDQSTSATKALLFDENGVPVRRVSIEHRLFYPQPGWVEQDPVEILNNTKRAVAELVAGARVGPESVAAVALTNQRETIVAWDEVSGKPVYPAIVWQDERGTPYCEALPKRIGSDRVKAKTGLVVDSYFSASKLQWLLESWEPAQSAARAGRLLAGTIDSWLIWNLTGRTVFATDYSNASRTLLFDIGRLRWDEELVDAFSLRGVRLPEPRPSDAAFGTADFDGALSVPIVGVMGDSHAALFGQAGFDAGNAKATYGTGSSIMMNVGEKLLSPPDGIVTSVGWGVDGGVCYVFEGNVHYSGDTVRWVRDNLGLFSDYGEAEGLASGLATNGGVYLVPAFSGLGAPHWVHGVRAIITGLSRGAGKAEIIRAAIESIAYQVTDVVLRMTSEESVAISNLRVDGAPTSNSFLMQFQADLLGAPVEIAAIEEISARGVAYAAGLRTGLWDSARELSSLAKPRTSFRPEIDTPSREQLLAQWHRAVEQTIAARE